MARNLLKMLKDNSHARSTFDVQKCGNKFVVGAGFGRTGTTSLQVALQQLGFNSYHSTTAADNPADGPVWLNALNLKMQKLNQNNAATFNDWYTPQCMLTDFNWEDIFQTKMKQKYNASVGGPSIPFYMDILHFYENEPYNYDVKVIFTQRNDEHIWYKSFRDSIGKSYEVAHKSWLLKRLFGPTSAPKIMQKSFVELVLDVQTDPKTGFNFDIHEKKMKERYLEWNKAVVENIPSDKLLIFDVQEGWQPLCEFLDVDVPENEFPRSNETKDFKRMVNIMRFVAMFANGVVIVVGLQLFVYLIKLQQNKNESTRDLREMRS